jgi:hypothetical protein
MAKNAIFFKPSSACRGYPGACAFPVCFVQRKAVQINKNFKGENEDGKTSTTENHDEGIARRRLAQTEQERRRKKCLVFYGN